jgi:dihydroorotate dehydrogenase electron transfer subunit
MPHVLDCAITAHLEAAPGHYRLVLNAPEIAQGAHAGQFCMLQVQEGLYPFLRRPMSIERIFEDGISVLYKVEGEGTHLLSTLNPGQSVNVQGPLGKPFPIHAECRRPMLVAGGIGVAPFPALAEALLQTTSGVPEVILAARTEDMLLCEKDFHQMGCAVHLATDDGSAGDKAFASQVLEKLSPGSDTIVYACGPMPMMRATHEVCQKLGIPCFASLEAEMACGDGVCLGCVVESKEENEAERMLRVCRDGPVFDTTRICWDSY